MDLADGDSQIGNLQLIRVKPCDAQKPLLTQAPIAQPLEQRKLLACISFSGTELQVFESNGSKTSVVSQSGSNVTAS